VGGQSEDLGIDGKIILKWILGKLDEKLLTEHTGSEQVPMASSCESGNDHLGSIKGREFLH